MVGTAKEKAVDPLDAAACSRSLDTPETDEMASMRRTHQEWQTHGEKLERERNAAQSGNRTLADERDELRRTNEGLQLTFDLRWKADQRAIKRWQEAHPGTDLTWPDHADMVVWLMEQIHSENAIAVAPPTQDSNEETK